MRNDSDRWQPAGEALAGFAGPGVTVTPVQGRRQTLISGPVAGALAAVGLTRAHGWPEVVAAAPYALRLRRDRVLVVDGPALPAGWDAQAGLAVSDMSDGLHIIEISGEKAFDLIRAGTEISRADASASVVRLLAGHEVALYFHGGGDRLRLHVSAPEAPALMLWLRRVAGLAEEARQ